MSAFTPTDKQRAEALAGLLEDAQGHIAWLESEIEFLEAVRANQAAMIGTIDPCCNGERVRLIKAERRVAQLEALLR